MPEDSNLAGRVKKIGLDPAILPIAVAGLVLVGAVLWLLTRPMPMPATEATPAAATQAATEAATQAATQAIAELRQAAERRIAALEARPVPTAPDLAPLTARIAALEGRPAAPAVDFGPLTARIAALEGRPAPDLAPLAARLAALEGRPAPDLSALAPRAAVTALEGRLTALEATLAQRGAALEAQAARLTALEAAAQRLAALESRAARLGTLEALRAALEAGRPLSAPLGDLPNPPAALARFATAAPPTEAALRLAFDAAARAGRDASDPSRQGAGPLDSAVSVLSGLVTVRRGETLVWGDSALAEIEAARRAVDAGDLEGAVARLKRLAPPVQQAMAGWIAPAEALVAARAALRQLVAG
jgi:hypothetical protein